MGEYDLALEATIGLPAVGAWIDHAKFHATPRKQLWPWDEGYATQVAVSDGGSTDPFDWDCFFAALSNPKFRKCCSMVHYIAEVRVRDLLGSNWWHAYREAMLDFVATQLDEQKQAA